jgi:hypothetical protein
MVELISPDDIKNEIEGYSPERASDFHTQSAKIADKRFKGLLQTSSSAHVILLSGGPASGKTEFYSEYLSKEDCIVYDGVLPTVQGAEIKLSLIRKHGKKAKIYAIWPYDLKQAFIAFLHRDRKFEDSYFFEKHVSARQTLLNLAKKYPDLEIRIFKNAYLQGKLNFTELEFPNQEVLVAYLEENQYTVEEIIKLITN